MKAPIVAKTSAIGTAMGRALSTAMIAGGVAGFATIFAMAGREVVGFEQKMIDVRANARLLGKEGEEAFQRLNFAAREMGATTQFTANQAAEALNWMVLGGLNAREAIEAVPSVLNLASSANLELAESAKIVVDNMRKYGMEASDTGKIADFLSSAQSRAQITARDLAQGLQALGSITTSMNVSFQDTMALLTGMGRAGTEMSRGGTALSMALFRLAAPPKETERALQKMNIQVDSFVNKQSGVLDLIGLFKAVAVAMPVDPIERGAAAAALFGMRAREILGVLGLLRDSTFVEETQVGLMEDLGRAAEVSEAKLEKFWGMLKKVRSILGELAIAGLTPVLKELMPLLEGIRVGTAMFAKFVSWVYKTADAIVSLPFGFLLSGFWDVIKVGGILTGVIVLLEFAIGKLSLAFMTLGGFMGGSILVLGQWKIALVAIAGVLDTVLIYSIAALGIALDALMAHPVVAALVTIAAGFALLAREVKRTNAIIKEGNEITTEFVERGKKREIGLAEQVSRLLELGKADKLNNEQMKEAQGIINDMEGLYGSLGIRIDQATGSILGMAKGFELLAAKNSKWRMGELKQQLRDLSNQFREAEEASHGGWGREGALSEMLRLQEKIDAVRKEMAKVESDSGRIPGVSTGAGDSGVPGEVNKAALEARSEAETELKKDLFAGIKELDVSTVTNEFQLLERQVSTIVKEFPELEKAAKQFLQLQWEDTPWGEIQGKFKDLQSEIIGLRGGVKDWQVELSKFAKMPWVEQWQIDKMRNMLLMRERLKKEKVEDQRFEGMAKQMREKIQIETPTGKMQSLVSNVMALIKRDRAGLSGGMSQEEGMKRLQMERQNVFRWIQGSEGKGQQEPITGSSRFGFADYGKVLQDAFLKSDDPAKNTAINTKQANVLLGTLNKGIETLSSKIIPKVATYQ